MSSLFKALFNTSTSKHKKLSENWDSLREPVVEGVTFYCKYLGSCLVEEAKGEVATAEAIKKIIQAAKQTSSTPQRVALNVSLRGITAEDTTTNQLLMQTSIYSISYCSADAHYDHVFAYIANNDNDTCECHAYLCPKRKMAQAVTVSIAQAFELAYESWKMETAGTSRDTDENGIQDVSAETKVGNGEAITLQTPPSRKRKNRKPSIQSCVSSPMAIQSECGSDELNTSGYASSIMGPATSSQALLIDLEESFEQKPKYRFDSDISNKLFMPNDLDVGCVTDEFSNLALRHGQQAENGYQTDDSGCVNPFSSHKVVWQSGGSSSNESSAATSPTITKANFFDHSPPSTCANLSNTDFLMMCNSPTQVFGITEIKKEMTKPEVSLDMFQELDPLNSGKTTVDPFNSGKTTVVPFNSEKTMVDPLISEKTMMDPFYSAKTTVDPFDTLPSRQCLTSSVRDPFAPVSSVDPFQPIQSSEVSTTTSSPNLSCGVRRSSYSNQLFQSSDLLCS